MQAIKAQVSKKLLSKASRLFTGTADGRVIEILQNARRAGAAHVKITNRDGFIVVEDNGSGIEDFARLLDLGSSGWDENMEKGEDPAGVGLFCLSPGRVEIISRDKKAVIENDGWTGEPVEIVDSQEFVDGTRLVFTDQAPWDMELVEKHAVFAGIRVSVDGKICHQMPFCCGRSENYDTPGCRIEVVEKLSKYHQRWIDRWHHGRVLVNFHGQVVQFDHWPADNTYGLTILVDLNAQSDIRLMLPARTKLIKNAALEKLKELTEIEFYNYFKHQKTHRLHYKEYLRAKQLGIELDEAEPQYRVGLLCGEYNESAEVIMLDGMKLEDCYLCSYEDLKDGTAEANAHLLSALGRFKGKHFTPVAIDKDFMGYSWTKLPKVTKVSVETGKERLRHGIFSNELACFDKISISVETSDGKRFASDVCMAIKTSPPDGRWNWTSDIVCVTEKARTDLDSDNIWFHLGGYDVDGDSYDTQLEYFEKDIAEFWNELVGPYESLRRQIQYVMQGRFDLRDKYKRVIFSSDGSLEIIMAAGKAEIVRPPK